MATNANGFWDFKSYSERTWFKYLVIILLVITASYVLLHYFYRNKNYDYEYTRLNQDQMQVLNRIYMDALKPDSTKSKKDSAAHSTIKTPPATDNLDKQRLVIKVMDYLDNTFDQSLEKIQSEHIECFLEEATPEESTAYLNQTRFKVKSYFWLIGPSVYWEVVFWTLFGVLCNLLFILGAVGSNATTDMANPQSQFDNSEILGQVARLLYAPLCTLAVILGYNFFKDQNVVDIDSSKGLIVFAFIGGYYSSRVIALMDRLKDVLLPNSGSSSLATPGSSTTPFPVIPQVQVQLAFDSTVPRITAASVTLNNSTVTLTGVGQGKHYTAVHMPGDPEGLFTFSSVTPANYTINANLVLPASAQQQSQNLSGVIKGQIMSGTAPIPLTLKFSNTNSSTHSTITLNSTHNMSTIKIAPTADQVQLNFSFQTQQVFSYKIQVMDDAGNVSFSDNGSWDGKRSFTLGQGSDLVGKYLSIDWAIVDPQGGGNVYTAAADASQNNINCPASQAISGTSTATVVNQSSSAQFLS